MMLKTLNLNFLDLDTLTGEITVHQIEQFQNEMKLLTNSLRNHNDCTVKGMFT